MFQVFKVYLMISPNTASVYFKIKIKLKLLIKKKNKIEITFTMTNNYLFHLPYNLSRPFAIPNEFDAKHV